MTFLKDKSILITGGTGSFGKAFVRKIYNDFKDIKRLVVFSRDELKQYELQKEFNLNNFPQIRYFLGDVRDRLRLTRALSGIDIVVHAAALKQVPAAEYNPFEFINTNIIGAENIVQSCMDTSVRKVVALSTDKAAAPINLYGATKLCSDKLFIAANNVKGDRNLSFSVVRYGNVMSSRGSVIPLFKEQSKNKTLTITDPKMTRFNITLPEGVDLVLWTIKNSFGGEIVIPKIPSYKITDVAEAICPDCKINIIGIRPGEKLHEEMVTKSDSLSTIDIGSSYIILPNSNEEIRSYYKDNFNSKDVSENFSYNSEENNNYLILQIMFYI
mgnify:CR=1 FL=1